MKNLVANNENEIADVMKQLPFEEKIRRVKRLFDFYEVLDILGYNDCSMSQTNMEQIDSAKNPVEQEKIVYDMAVNNGNFEYCIAINKRLEI